MLVGGTVIPCRRREVSGRQISVSTYYCFFDYDCLLGWLVCLWGFCSGFCFYFLLLSNIPNLCSYLVHIISRIFQRVAQTEGALSIIFIQLIL